MMHSTASTSFARGKGQPDRDIYNLFATLNQELVRERHDIGGLYEGRLRSHARGFEDLKRKWEEFTGVSVPKKIRSLEPSDNELVANEKTVNFVKNIPTSVIEEDGEEDDEQQPVTIATTNPMTISQRVEEAKSSAPPTTTMPPHPDDRIDVDNMVVNDLRKELKKRQLATAGRKAELQERLREYLVKANSQREIEWASKHATDIIKEDTILQKKQVQISNNNRGGCINDVAKLDVVMEDDKESIGDRAADDSQGIKSASVVKEEESVPLQNRVAQPSNVPTTMTKKQAPKSALKPSKYPSSFIENACQLADTKPAPESMPRSFVRVGSPCPKQLISTKISNSSTESSTSTSALPTPAFEKSLVSSLSKLNTSYSQAYTTPGTTAFRTGGAESATLLQKKQVSSAAQVARKVMIEEMRQRLQPAIKEATSTTKPPPSHTKYAIVSSLKKMAPSSSSSEIKQNPIQAVLREKMAAQKTSERTDPTPPILPSQTVAPIQSITASSTIETTLQTHVPTPSQYAPKPHPTALINKVDPSNKPVSSPNKTPLEKQLSPMQTYEMSDREESDSDCESDEEDEQQRPKKSIPLWAQKANLHRALERQFADGPDRLDPDKIFGEVLTCNLEEIFDKKKSRYQRRTSSGNWTKDHVTLAEKLTYKRTMGYDKK